MRLKWDIANGYYLYKERFQFQVVGSQENRESSSFGKPVFSTYGELKNGPYFGNVHVIKDKLSIFIPNTTDSDEEVEIRVIYQGCAEAGLCYSPKNQLLMFMPHLKNLNIKNSIL